MIGLRCMVTLNLLIFSLVELWLINILRLRQWVYILGWLRLSWEGTWFLKLLSICFSLYSLLFHSFWSPLMLELKLPWLAVLCLMNSWYQASITLIVKLRMYILMPLIQNKMKHYCGIWVVKLIILTGDYYFYFYSLYFTIQVF
jgi:hypothetical protein